MKIDRKPRFLKTWSPTSKKLDNSSRLFKKYPAFNLESLIIIVVIFLNFLDWPISILDGKLLLSVLSWPISSTILIRVAKMNSSCLPRLSSTKTITDCSKNQIILLQISPDFFRSEISYLAEISSPSQAASKSSLTTFQIKHLDNRMNWAISKKFRKS